MLPLLRYEMRRVFGDRRVWYAVGFVLLLVVLAAVAFHYAPFRGLERMLEREGLGVRGRLRNGYFLLSRVMMPSFLFFIPAFTAVLTAEQLAGERAAGTLRTLLVQPVGRLEVYAVKQLVAVLFALLLSAVLAAGGALVGLWWFGRGEVFIFDMEEIGRPVMGVLTAAEAPVRMLWGALYGAGAVCFVAFMGLALSACMTGTANAATATVGLYLVSAVLAAVPTVGWLKQWLPATHIGAWRLFLHPVVPVGQLLRSFLAMLGGSVFFFLAGVTVFSVRDLTD